jgi:branched-chain amino acid transport system permease protein
MMRAFTKAEGNWLLRDRSPETYMATGVATVVLVMACVPQVAGQYQVLLLTYGLILGISGLGFNLLLGYTGLLSFGHAAFFGAGAYTAAFLMRDFGIVSMEVWLAASAVATCLLALLFGLVCVRHTRIFFSILTLALSQVLWSLAMKLFWVTGGSDGIRVKAPMLLGSLVQFTGSRSFVNFVYGYYYYVLAIFLVLAGTMWVIVNSPFGKALQAIRDNETRAEFIGIEVRKLRLIAFVISGLYGGLAGTLWVPLNGLVTPESLYWLFSGEIVFLTLLGGFRTFAGPMVGAVVFTYLKAYAVGATEYWQLVLGVVLVTLVLALPTGIVGTVLDLVPRLKAKLGI